MPIDKSSSVTGYHGTEQAHLTSILNGKFIVSQNDYDWLGDGVYFFQDAPKRALIWAKERFGQNIAIVGADIKLESCIDLLDANWAEFLADVYDKYLERINQEGITLPHQSSGAHRLDRAILNFAVTILEQEGVYVKSIRAAFIEGGPIYPNSALFSKAHVQLAIRDESVITKRWHEFKSEENTND